MRSLARIHRMSLWPVLTLACALLAGSPACRGDDVPAGDSAAAGAKAATADTKDTMQKALQEAQAAYEKEQRELKDRLEKDPLWQPSHENVAVIKPGKGPIQSFCRNKDGNLLICCGAEQPSLLAGLLGARADTQRGEIAVFSPKGKKIADWKMPLPPQAICLGDDGVIYVAGGGRIAKLDDSGKVLVEADAPNASELPPLTEVKKEPKKEGPEAEAAEKAKKEKIADLTKQMEQAQKDYTQAVTDGQKDLKPNDDEARQAFQEKLSGPMEKLQAAQQELQEATLTPEMRAAQAREMRERMTTVTGMAVTDRDLFVCCASTKGFGYVVWRTDHNFAKPKKIVENLAGCCGQMDVQAHGGDLWVAHNCAAQGRALQPRRKEARLVRQDRSQQRRRFRRLLRAEEPPLRPQRYRLRLRVRSADVREAIHLVGQVFGSELGGAVELRLRPRDDGVRRRARPLLRAQQRRAADPRFRQEDRGQGNVRHRFAQDGQRRTIT